MSLNEATRVAYRPTRKRVFVYLAVQAVLLITASAHWVAYDPWNMWRHGRRIHGPIVAVEHKSAEADRITVRDPATGIDYSAVMWGTGYRIGDYQTVVADSRDAGKARCFLDLYAGLAIQFALVIACALWPFWLTRYCRVTIA